MKATINLYNADCLPAMRKMADNQYSLALVDPPYGIDFVSKGQIGNSKFTPKEWDKKIPDNKYFIELKRISKNQIIWGANYFKFLFPNRSFIYWNKLNHDNKGDGELATTSFDIGNRYFEYMWDGNRYGTYNNIKGVGKPTIRIHPTEKPIDLYKFCLKNYAKENDTILDTHFGSLSIGIACHDYGYSLDAYEIDRDYFEAGKKRLNTHKSQLQINYE